MRYLTLLTIFYYPVYVIYYILKRIVYMFVYPFAYVFRNKARDESKYWYDYHKAIRKEYKGSLFWTLIWGALDDVTLYENVDKEWIKAPKWLPTDFLKSYYWGAIRNNAVNLSRILAIKEFKDRIIHVGGKYNFFEIKHFKGFPYYAPYFQFYIPKTFIRIKAGWLTNGKYEMSIREKII